MKNPALAQWLQDHAEMLSQTRNSADAPFHIALYEGIIGMAITGETGMMVPLLESAAARAVATGRPLTNLLGVPQRLRARIWERIGEEIDPEPAFAMLSAVDTIFVEVIRLAIDAYVEASRLAHAASAAEISRLYTESEQRVMEYAAQVARANRELARLEQAKTDFISIAAHELKTPLTLVQGYVNILNDLETSAHVATLVEGINRGVERMNSIVEDMLDLSAMDMNKLGLILEPVNLATLVGLVVGQVNRALIERQQTLETIGLELLPLVEADVRRLHQVLRHLLGNAIKYTPDGGRITVTGRTLPASGTRPECIELKIQDTGIGIAPEDREKVFEKFYRVGNSNLHSTGKTKFMGAGPGLGLAIVKGLIEAHGGRVWAESEGFDLQNYPGSTFAFVLPISAAPRPGVPVQWMPGGKIKD